MARHGAHGRPARSLASSRRPGRLKSPRGPGPGGVLCSVEPTTDLSWIVIRLAPSLQTAARAADLVRPAAAGVSLDGAMDCWRQCRWAVAMARREEHGGQGSSTKTRPSRLVTSGRPPTSAKRARWGRIIDGAASVVCRCTPSSVRGAKADGRAGIRRSWECVPGGRHC
ncbi:hypothetical protein BD413DRAFT_243589 [Trametes elegans]|nr:hypothetical protein BD413DRAFT_243589 [Trametes elegans]